MLNRVVSVDAESEEEALKKVNEANDNGEIEIDYEDNYSGEQIELDNDQDTGEMSIMKMATPFSASTSQTGRVISLPITKAL